jgi:hypothetical protein
VICGYVALVIVRLIGTGGGRPEVGTAALAKIPGNYPLDKLERLKRSVEYLQRVHMSDTVDSEDCDVQAIQAGMMAVSEMIKRVPPKE